MSISPRGLPLFGVAAGLFLTAPILGATVLAAEPTVVVEPGDTLSELALEHGVGMEQLVAINGLADPDRIYVGQRLILARDAGQTVAGAAPASGTAAASTVHTVASGENLTWIARRYGTTVQAIVAANAIANPRLIHPGQQLSIPGGAAGPDSATVPAVAAPQAPAAAPAPTPSTVHTVASGENLTWIARRYGTTVQAIVAANAIANPRLIHPGQQLSIPGREAPPAPPAPAVTPLPPEREAVRQMLVEEATHQAVPAAFVLAVAWQESGWRQGALSSAGAVGVMQLLPATGQWVGDVMLGESVDIHEVRSNIRAGVRLLAHYLSRYGTRELALAAYYQGQAGTDRHGVYPGSWAYVNSILRLEAAFGG